MSGRRQVLGRELPEDLADTLVQRGASHSLSAKPSSHADLSIADDSRIDDDDLFEASALRFPSASAAHSHSAGRVERVTPVGAAVGQATSERSPGQRHTSSSSAAGITVVPGRGRVFVPVAPIPASKGDVAVAKALSGAAVQAGPVAPAAAGGIGSGSRVAARPLAAAARTGPTAAASDSHASPTTLPPSASSLQAQHQATLADQDQALDALSGHVEALGQLSLAIGSELAEQDRLIVDTDVAVEAAHSRVSESERQIRRLIARSGGPGWAGVLCAMVLLLILLTWIALS